MIPRVISVPKLKTLGSFVFELCYNAAERRTQSETDRQTDAGVLIVILTRREYKTSQFPYIQGGAKTGPPFHCSYSEIPLPNCVKIGELLQYYMLNTVINFLFKNFIALWRHLAKTQLLSFIHIV